MLTIEELYLFKAQYQAQIEELTRKKAVVDEFIAYAESKEHIETPTEETSESVETEAVEYETPVTDGDY